jgi:(p)ppGpp synthase/HD superfamily hydrolase
MEKMSSYALVIKLSDRRDNVKDLNTLDKKFKEKYTKETTEILDHLES